MSNRMQFARVTQIILNATSQFSHSKRKYVKMIQSPDSYVRIGAQTHGYLMTCSDWNEIFQYQIQSNRNQIELAKRHFHALQILRISNVRPHLTPRLPRPKIENFQVFGIFFVPKWKASFLLYLFSRSNGAYFCVLRFPHSAYANVASSKLR